jgi:hypothetical protein
MGFVEGLVSSSSTGPVTRTLATFRQAVIAPSTSRKPPQALLLGVAFGERRKLDLPAECGSVGWTVCSQGDPSIVRASRSCCGVGPSWPQKPQLKQYSTLPYVRLLATHAGRRKPQGHSSSGRATTTIMEHFAPRRVATDWWSTSETEHFPQKTGEVPASLLTTSSTDTSSTAP